jgi:hypothetical protein
LRFQIIGRRFEVLFFHEFGLEIVVITSLNVTLTGIAVTIVNSNASVRVSTEPVRSCEAEVPRFSQTISGREYIVQIDTKPEGDDQRNGHNDERVNESVVLVYIVYGVNIETLPIAFKESKILATQ